MRQNVTAVNIRVQSPDERQRVVRMSAGDFNTIAPRLDTFSRVMKRRRSMSRRFCVLAEKIQQLLALGVFAYKWFANKNVLPQKYFQFVYHNAPDPNFCCVRVLRWFGVSYQANLTETLFEGDTINE